MILRCSTRLITAIVSVRVTFASGLKVPSGYPPTHSLAAARATENKNVAEGQLTMYNYKLAEIAHELDKVDVNELTPIEALNTLVKIKEKMSG